MANPRNGTRGAGDRAPAPVWQGMVLVFLLIVGGGADAEREVRLVTGGRAACSVTFPLQATDAELLAARELRTYLGKISGADIPLGDGKPTRIFLGRASAFANLPFAPPKLEPEHFLIRTNGGDLYLLGADDAGVSHAVYTLLHDLGCRWFMPGEIGEVIPRNRDITINPVNRIDGPDFALRSIWFSWSSKDPLNTPEARARHADWCRRNRTGGARVNMSHNLVHGPLPPDRYFKDHPEYYALVNGVRTPRQPCTSNPEVIDIVTREVIRYFDENPDTVSYSLSPEDNADFCQCPNCTALDSGKRDPGFSNYPVVTDRLVKFYNAVAQRLQQEHPGKCVAFYAYFNHTLPPTTVKVDPHVLVAVTAQQFCTLHSVTDRDCASRRKMAAIIEEYASQTPFVYIREYDPMPGSGELPAPLFGAHLRDMPWYKRAGVKGFSWESHQSWATLTPNHYVLAQMMWDADQDPRALVADFYEKFFGPAAVPMRRYYETLEGAFSRATIHPGWGNASFPSLYSAAVMRQCADALREARSLARQSSYRERVRMIGLGFAYLDSWLAFKRAIVVGDYEGAVAAKGRAARAVRVLSNLNGGVIVAPEANLTLAETANELAWILPKSLEFRRANDIIAELPPAWRFRREGDEQAAAAWAAPDYDDSAWRMIRTNSQWWEQLKEPLENCRAWARARFGVPESFRGRRIILRFGGLDVDDGRIYLNGKLVHRRTMVGENWAEPFEVDITDAVRFDAGNVLAVRARAEGTLGGVWRGVVVYAAKP